MAATAGLAAYVRAGATVFETVSVKPIAFLGTSGVQFNYNYVGGDEVRRRGRSVVAIVNKKLYLMSLDGAAVHYYEPPDQRAIHVK